MRTAIKSPPGKGTKEAAALMETLRKSVHSNVNGVSIPGVRYENTNITDGDAVQHLAQQDRDIRPGDDDAMATGIAYLGDHTRRVRRYQGRRVPITQQEGDAIQTGAFREAIKIGRKRMAKRIETMTLTDGSPAAKVSKHYATWRRKNYSVPDYVVFKRTGQLLKTVLSGRLKFHRR